MKNLVTKILLMVGFFIAQCGLSILPGCKPKAEDSWVKYEIRKDNHYSVQSRPFNQVPKDVYFKAKFDESCLYWFDDVDQYDINKLYGYKFGLFGVHENSLRFGWRTSECSIEILWYVYRDGERLSGSLGFTEPNKIDIYKISEFPEYVRFEFNGTIQDIEYNIPDPIRYRNYPYFGGNKTAPHYMFINIKDL